MAVILLVFQVYGETDSDDSDVKISVQNSCTVLIDEFQPPTNGSKFMAKNSTGYFTELIQNTGSLRSNITVEYLNVTKQNESWDPGEPIGPVVQHYNGTNFTNVSADEEVLYQEQFNATYETGWYTGRSN
ncbi:MAG: hypothetical protein ABEJ72_01315, partial [Candidatus Aenigmatarchaeota archaeon]